jgi:hypothetical protein
VFCRPRIVWVSDTRFSLSTRGKACQFACLVAKRLPSKCGSLAMLLAMRLASCRGEAWQGRLRLAEGGIY